MNKQFLLSILILCALQPLFAMKATDDHQGRLNEILIGTIRRTNSPSTSEVQEWIDAGADVNAKHPMYGAPLQCAIRNKHTELCSLLLENGATLIPAHLMCVALPTNNCNKHIAKLFVDHQKKLEQKMYCLLWCLKKSEHSSCNMVYKLSKHLLAPYLKKYTLKVLLNERSFGKTPYFWAKQNEKEHRWKDVEWLKPIGCPICWQQKTDTLSVSPCCKQPICEQCWEKSIQENEDCPFC